MSVSRQALATPHCALVGSGIPQRRVRPKFAPRTKTTLERLKEEQAKTIKLSEGKRTEMRQALDTVIMNWLQDAVKDEKVRDEFKAGMTRLAEDAKDDAGVWQVVCCASNVHAQRLQEIEKMRLENEELKSKGAGDFRDEASRKRGREEAEKPHDSNVWLQFEQEISTGRTFGTGV